MAIAFVKKSTQSFGDGVTSFSTSLAGVTAGNLVVVTVDKASGGDSNNPALAMPAPDGGGWSTAIAGTGPTGTGAYRPVNAIFYKLASAGGTETVTWSSLPGDSYIEATISEFSCSGTWAFDAGIRTVGDGTSPQSVSGISNSTAVALAIAVVATDANTITNLVGPTSGYTQIDLSDNNSAHNCYGSGYKILAATAAQSAGWTWTGSGPWMGSLAIFREVASSGTNLTPGQDAIALTGFAPTLAQTANQSLVPGADAIAMAGLAPTLAQTAHQSLTPGADTVAITGFAPTLTQTAGTTLTPGQAALTVTGQAPTLAQTAHQSLTPGQDAVVITGHVPAVVQASGSVSLVPAADELTITGHAPQLVQTGAVVLGTGGDDGWRDLERSIRRRRKRLAQEADAWLREQKRIERLERQHAKKIKKAQPLVSHGAPAAVPPVAPTTPPPAPPAQPAPPSKRERKAAKWAAAAVVASAAREAERRQAQAERDREQERARVQRRRREEHLILEALDDWF